ncbi:MAG: aldo/keto reductase [Alphaproteobacteria bacterium]
MNKQTIIQLSDGNQIPQLGLGVWQASDDEAQMAVAHAINLGYRHIDTAAIYKNEKGVGLGIKDASIPREEIFVTTKVWNSEQGAKTTKAALDESLKRLDLDYVDLFLIHWPCPKKGLYVETWKTLIEAKEQGKLRSIGVSNFNPEHIQKLIDETGVIPVLNQIEVHPYFQQNELRKALKSLGVKTQAWSPLGQGQVLSDETIATIAKKHGKTAAQVIIRWHMQLDNIAIPKSITPSRIEENFDIFSFELTAQDMAQIASLDKGLRLGPNPLEFE